MVVLDTNIIIDHLRQAHGKPTILERMLHMYPKDPLMLSVVSVQELYEGKSTLDTTKESMLLATITPLNILPYTFEVAEWAGKIARDFLHPIEFADAAIAATAIIQGGKLLTLNQKHFMGIPELEIVKI